MEKIGKKGSIIFNILVTIIYRKSCLRSLRSSFLNSSKCTKEHVALVSRLECSRVPWVSYRSKQNKTKHPIYMCPQPVSLPIGSSCRSWWCNHSGTSTPGTVAVSRVQSTLFGAARFALLLPLNLALCRNVYHSSWSMLKKGRERSWVRERGHWEQTAG